MEKSSRKMTYTGLAFLGLVLMLYGVAALHDYQDAVAAMTLAGKLLAQVLPVLLIVFVLIFLSNLLIRPSWVRSQLGAQSGWRGWALAVVAGILSVGPVYAWYALLRDLRDRGMRTALVSVFLYNRGVKLPLIPLMIHYFGLAFTLVLSAYLIMFSLIIGVIMEWLLGNEPQP
jgi:uncharacterized membrane protein YraQ (UPF0718 family)